MSIKIKKFKVLRFVNTKHSLFSRYLFASLGFISTLILTRSFNLAMESWYLFARDNYKLALRRIAKLIYIFTNIIVIKDDVFNIAEGLSMANLKVLEKKISMKILRKKNFNLYIDLLYVYAEQIILVDDNFVIVKKYEKLAFEAIQMSKTRESACVSSELMTQDNREPDYNVRDAKKCLYDWFECFPNDEHRWYVISGTFLGLVREKKFLEHDYDIDIGINSEDFSFKKIKSKINESKQFFISKIDYQHTYRRVNNNFIPNQPKLVLIKVIHESGINLDLFVHHSDKNNRWHGSKYHRWNNLDYSLIKYKFYDVDVFAPSDSDRYLTENYGNWREPLINFNFINDTPNFTPVKHPSATTLLLKRLFYMQNKYNHHERLIKLRDAGQKCDSSKFTLN